ncbi:unnamed protein product [Triticum turgidum subsp. durum]|uniref:Uncharacterized protein n=1 Tax=Triticum turgidum subsp. durum TaxID=4567 RepID=A0A9R0Y7I1_TRITD|nr:unnamed protein product [Triticum turgidum subsp. durum]
MPRVEVPPSSAAAAAFSFHIVAFALMSLPLSPSVASSTSLATSSRLTSLSISSPMPHSAQAYRQLVVCSAKKGQQTIGTPAQMLSSVEFHPECVRNSPVAGCPSTSSCGHQLRKIPRPFVSARKSSGSTALSPATRSGLMTHRNGRPQRARPHANSARWAGDMTVMLPKLTYTTEPGCFWASSHRRQLVSSFQRLPPIAPSSGRARAAVTANAGSGPTVYTRGKMPRSASTTSCSTASNVLRMTPCARCAFCASPPSKLSMTSSRSVVRTKLGKSRSLMPGIPATQSSAVSRYPLVRGW